MKDFKTGKNILYITPIPMDYGYSSDYYSNETLTTVKNNFKLYNNKLLREYGYTAGEALDITNQIDDFYTNLANNSLKYIDATTFSLMDAFEPLSATIGSVLIFHLQMTGADILGSILVIVAVLAINIRIPQKI